MDYYYFHVIFFQSSYFLLLLFISVGEWESLSWGVRATTGKLSFFFFYFISWILFVRFLIIFLFLFSFFEIMIYFLLPHISSLWSAGYSPEHVSAPRCVSHRQWAGLFFWKDVNDLYLQLSWRRRGWGKQWACSVSVRSCPRTRVFPCKPGRSSACTSGWWCEQFGF